MKKIIFLLFLVSASNTYAQQTFAPIGTEWYYGLERHPLNNGIVTSDYNLVRSTGEMIINGKNCNVISYVKKETICNYFSGIAVYQSNDTVYYYNGNLDKFSPLYIFSAVKGDTWTIENEYDNVQVLVDSVSTLHAPGRDLKVQHVTYKSNLGQIFSSSIIENLGDVADLFYFNYSAVNSCDEPIVKTGLRCYIHPEYGTYNTGVTGCDYVTSVPKLETSRVKAYINVGGSLCIESLDDALSSIRLLDMRGQTIYEKMNLGVKKYEIPMVGSGFMISVITLQSGEIVIRKTGIN